MKRVRADAVRRAHNLDARSKLRTMIRQFTQSLQKGQADQAKKLYPQLVKRIDQSSQKNILHRNTASRKKSRLARRLAKLG